MKRIIELKHIICFCVFIFQTMGYSAELLLETQSIYPNKFAYIIQTEKDSAQLKSPIYCISTDLYSGLKGGLWINAIDVSESKRKLEQYKAQYPGGYIKDLGQYRKIQFESKSRKDLPKSNWIIETQGFFVTDTQYVEKSRLFHLLRFWDSTVKIVYVDTFSVSLNATESVSATLYRTKALSLVLVRDYSSSVAGSVTEIRVFKQMGQSRCAQVEFTNDGGPEDIMSVLDFDKKDDAPIINGKIHDKIVSQKNVLCKER